MAGRVVTFVLPAVLNALAYASPVSSGPEFCSSAAWQHDELLQAMGARGVSCYAKMVCKAELLGGPEAPETETRTLTSTLYPSAYGPSTVIVTQTVTDGDAVATGIGSETTDIETVYVTHVETSTYTETQTDRVTETTSTITTQKTELASLTEVNTYTLYSTYTTVTDLVTTSTITQFATVLDTQYQTTEITETNVVSTLTDTEFDATATVFTTIATQTLTIPTATAYTTIPTATFTVVETVQADYITVVTETDYQTSTTVLTSPQVVTQSVTTTVVTNTVTQTVATVTNTVFQRRSLPTSAISDLRQSWISEYGQDHFHSACSCVVKQPLTMSSSQSYSAASPATVHTTYEILTVTAEASQPVTYTETSTVTKGVTISNSQPLVGTKTVTSFQTIQTTDSEGVTTTIVITATDDVDAFYTDIQTSTLTIDVTTTVITSVIASSTSDVDASTLLSVTDFSIIVSTVTSTLGVTATETLQLTFSETDPATATEITSIEVSSTVFDITTTTESTTATSVTSVGTTQTVGETVTTDIIVGTETATVTTGIEETVSAIATATATALAIPKTFLIQEVTGPRPGQYIYVSPSTSPTGRYIFFTSTVAQATRFTVNPITGNLQDTSTGYDVYLTNSNSVIAVTQAYDTATAATNPVSITGFKCVPDASKNIVCNNANNLNALYNCGAYLYAVTPTYNFAQCGTGRAVTFAAVSVTF